MRLGTLDFTLTKSVAVQLLISIQQVQIWKVTAIILGLATLGVALAQLERSVTAWNVIVFEITLLAGAAIVYSFWLVLTARAFGIMRVENILMIFQSMYEAGRWPVGSYLGGPRRSLTFRPASASAGTVVTNATGTRLTLQTLLGALALAATLLIVSRAP